MGQTASETIANKFLEKLNCKWQSLSQKIKVATEDKVQLWWWAQPSNVMVGQTLTQFKTEVMVFTDAFKEGWGAHTSDRTASGMRPSSWGSYPINWLELEAIRRALAAVKNNLDGKPVLVMCDNKSAVAYINKGELSPEDYYLSPKSSVIGVAHIRSG